MENKNKVSKILVVQDSLRKNGHGIALAEQIAKGAESVGAAGDLFTVDVVFCQVADDLLQMAGY